MVREVDLVDFVADIGCQRALRQRCDGQMRDKQVELAARQGREQFIVQMVACGRVHRDIPPDRSGRITAGIEMALRVRSTDTAYRNDKGALSVR